MKNHNQELASIGIEQTIKFLTDLVNGTLPATMEERLAAAHKLLSLGWSGFSG